MDLKSLTCWLLHRKTRQILLPGVLPWQIDAVVFCSQCDHLRGRGVRVFHLRHHLAART